MFGLFWTLLPGILDTILVNVLFCHLKIESIWIVKTGLGTVEHKFIRQPFHLNPW